MQAAPGSSSKFTLPVLAICCLGLILFIICTAVVLALIPVYLPRKDFTPTVDDDKSTEPFYYEYSADSDGDNAISGNIQNGAEIGKLLNLDDDIELAGGETTSDGVDRRKRSFFGSRPKRAIKILIILIFRYKSSDCNLQCVFRRRKFKTKMLNTKTISGCPIQINGGVLGTVNATFNLVFVGFRKSKPSNFRGPPSSLTFTTISSGDFTTSSIWNHEQLPNGPCNIVIAAGTIVVLSRPGLRIRAKSITIYGTLIIGGGNADFTFGKPCNIKIGKGGKLQDATSSKLIKLSKNSVFILLPGGSFTEAGTKILADSASGESFTITNPNGPFTCAILPSGFMKTYNKVAFIAVTSGTFKSGSTYCGGVEPTIDDCKDSACTYEVIDGVTLSTSDLNGELDINFDKIIVGVGAIFQIGTPGSSNNFKFKNPVRFECMGTISFVGSGGGILLPIGSAFAIFGGGKFISLVETFLQLFDPITAILGAIQVLTVSMEGPFGYEISVAGFIIIDVSLLGGPTTTPSASIAPA